MVAFEYDNWLCLCLVLKSLTIEREGWDAPAFVSVTLAYVAGSLAAVREPTILRAARPYHGNRRRFPVAGYLASSMSVCARYYGLVS